MANDANDATEAGEIKFKRWDSYSCYITMSKGRIYFERKDTPIKEITAYLWVGFISCLFLFYF